MDASIDSSHGVDLYEKYCRFLADGTDAARSLVPAGTPLAASGSPMPYERFLARISSMRESERVGFARLLNEGYETSAVVQGTALAEWLENR